MSGTATTAASRPTTTSSSSSPSSTPSLKTRSSTTTPNPILSRYLTTPIVFHPAKHQENYSSAASQLPASYIVLSKHNEKKIVDSNKDMDRSRSSSANGSPSSLGKGTKKEKVGGVKRPKSLAEAVASYSGNKYESPKERKRKRKLEERQWEREREKKRELKSEEDSDEEIYDDNDEESLESGEPPVKKSKKSRGLWGSLKSLFGGVSTGQNEEDVGEEFVEGDEVEESVSKASPFKLIRNEVDDDDDESLSSTSSGSADEVYDENSPFTGFSEPERSETGDDDEDEEEDPDFGDEDANGVSDEESDEESEEDDSDDEEDASYEENIAEEDKKSSTEGGTPLLESDRESVDDEDKDVGKLRHDLKVDELLNGQGKVYTITRRSLEEEEEEEEGQDVKEDEFKYVKSSSTPPTSPEDSDEQKSLVQTQFYSFNELPNDRGSNGSKRIYKNWRELTNAKPPVGLLNHGVTCYMNSAIQSLIHIPAFQHYLNDINEGKYQSQLKPRSVSHVLAELSKRMWNPHKPSAKYINPKKIIQRLDDINCMMSEWQQEDSHEYYMSLMSRLQEDSVPKGHKLNESIIYDIFGGLLHQRITCQQCHNISSTKQEFYDLSLGLNKKKYQNSCRFTIEKSINEFFSNEVIRKNDQDSKSGYYCDKCSSFTQANKISSIITAPETLTVHLKRFKFNGNSSSKVKQGISYSKYLDLTKYMDRGDGEEGEDENTTTSQSASASSAKYQLIAVIVHEGRSISSGHYICHVLQPDGLSWSTYDDEYINRIDEKKALSDANAYVLVYTKLTPKQ
ncbi:hypothetical protein I9W82_003399 [Candida metapsilosis]|uniref:ubiquitinyl hydrolase 1 n=1 Tax=Candida metapsilosis TaxID=273372 RepID=A0A8H7ZH07_9ASCO|nr:hypothetical protein I9W82_003399 [Candida metapsilosis]